MVYGIKYLSKRKIDEAETFLKLLERQTELEIEIYKS